MSAISCCWYLQKHIPSGKLNSGLTWIHSVCSSWLPASPLQESAAASRLPNTSAPEPQRHMQQHGTGLTSPQCRGFQASASSQVLNHSQQHHQALGASGCIRPRAEHSLLHAACKQPAASPSAAKTSPGAQAFPARTIQTPHTGTSACTEAQQTYSRRRRNESSTGRQAKRCRATDYAWLQGADDTPVTDSQHVRQGLVWWNSESTGQSDEPQLTCEERSAAAAISSTGPQSHQATLVR